MSDALTGQVRHALPCMALFCPVAVIATGPRNQVAVGMADGTVRVVVIGDELR